MWRTITLFNPVVYLISGFRWSFYGKSDVNVLISLGLVLRHHGRLPGADLLDDPHRLAAEALILSYFARRTARILAAIRCVRHVRQETTSCPSPGLGQVFRVLGNELPRELAPGLVSTRNRSVILQSRAMQQPAVRIQHAGRNADVSTTSVSPSQRPIE